MKIHFTKMQGLGNDFMVIGATKNPFPLNKQQIQNLANRKTGVGFDQLLVLQTSDDERADFIYRIFNADGSEVAQCGNGARCLARFIEKNNLSHKKEWILKTTAGFMKIKLAGKNLVTVEMGQPKFSPAEIPFLEEKTQVVANLQEDKKSFQDFESIKIVQSKPDGHLERSHSELKIYQIVANKQTIYFFVANIGNPHAIILSKKIADLDINEIGFAFNHHPAFPEGVNVNFMEIINSEEIQLRVFERGVGETLACGSGACASVTVGIKTSVLKPKVKVKQAGGELIIEWPDDKNPLIMTGPAEFVYEGFLESYFVQQ